MAGKKTVVRVGGTHKKTDELTPNERKQVLERAGHRCECTNSNCDHPPHQKGSRCTNKHNLRAHCKDRSRPHTPSSCEVLCKDCHGRRPTTGKPSP